jgi:dTDP-4-dehydrorhamnose reductase
LFLGLVEGKGAFELNKHSKIIIVGATGYIGKQLHVRAIGNSEVYGTSSTGDDGLNRLQLDAPDKFNYEIIQPSDIVFLTAAISAPDICAREYGRAWAVNVTGTSEFVTQVISRGGRVVFFSSDTVYGERGDAFDETAKSNPAGEYAEMKAEVEKRFLGNPLFKSIRLSYVFSREDKFTRYLSGGAERGEEVELFHPFYRAIVHRDDVVEGTLALAQRWDEFPQQVINFGGPEVLSRIDFAECLQRIALPSLRFRVTEPGDEFFKNRPRVIAMSSDIFPKLLGWPSRTMTEAARVEFG